MLVWRNGGGADARMAPPGPDIAQPASAETKAHGSEAFEVKMRLTEAMADARIDVPSFATSMAFLQAHWRRIRGPWVQLPGVAGQLVMTIALRTSEKELQWAVPTNGGRRWAPDARIWNMNEGSFDQREAIFTPTPATIAFHVTVPLHARLELSPAIVFNLPAATVFAVSAYGADGVEHELWRLRVQPGDAKKWFEASMDLSRFGGQSIELRLQTWTDKPTPDEKKWAPKVETDQEKAKKKEKRILEPPVPTMSLALWGHPAIVARQPTRVPYNVLWIVVDALRADIVTSFHDDAEDTAKRGAHVPPLDAFEPKIPGLTPNIDALAARGVRFTHAYSGGAWTRPGTLAMLSGVRSSQLGITPLPWVVPADEVARFYASDPPLLPLLLRKSGVATRAFVNNFFMIGYALVGVDMGFERVDDHRYRTQDTAAITGDAMAWLERHKDERFFTFVNYNSPHDPYDPPEAYKARVPPPPAGPRDPTVRLYMAEAAKDDEAVGVLLAKLDALGLTKDTIVVLTADHGETLSTAHSGYSGLDKMPVRFHHAVSNFEETTHVPLVVALPGVADDGRAVTARVRGVDIAPTVLDLEGVEPSPKTIGKSMMPLVRGEKEPDERVVVSEGRGTRAVMWGKYRLLVREGQARFTYKGPPPFEPVNEELYDLEDDPGERHDIAKAKPDVVAELRARLAAAMANVPTAGSAAATATAAQPVPAVHLRFAGGGRARRVSGTIVVGDPKHPAPLPPSIAIEPVGVAREALRVDGARVEIALVTAADAVTGLDMRIDPPSTPMTWQLYLDDQPWPESAVFAGPFGLPANLAKLGISSEDARVEVFALALPAIDPARELGVFVTRDRPGDLTAPERAMSGEGASEMTRILQDWGYAHGSH
jgi:arylsulfatase A-like enzyme